MVKTMSHLPDEIIVKILLNLPWKSILVTQRVDQRFRALIRGSKLVQYTIELGCAGVMDCGSTGGESAEERLDRLLDYQRSWRRLESKRRQLIKHQEGPIWELAGGVLAQGIPDTPGSFDVHKFVFTRLARDTRGRLDEEQWTYENHDVEIKDFTMDPSQDLAVFIWAPPPADYDQTSKYVFELLSLKTFEKHPKATSGTLMHEIDALLANRSNNIQQICANYICVLHSAQFDSFSKELILWDWVSGEMKFRLRDCMIHSFSFVTPEHLLFALNIGPESYATYGNEPPIRLVVCDIEVTAKIKNPDSREEGQDLYAAACVLDLPDFQSHADVVDVLIRSDPAPLSYEHTVSSVTNDEKNHGVPFRLSSQNRLFVVNMSVYPADEIDEEDDRSDYINLALFIPLATLLTCIESSDRTELLSGAAALSRSSIAVSPGIHVRWNDWLPHGTRMLVLPNEERVWVCNVYGSRFVYPLESAEAFGEPAPRRFAVMDFNADMTRRAIADSGNGLFHSEEFPDEVAHQVTSASTTSAARANSIEASRVEWSCAPTTLAVQEYEIFTRDVTTHLPFQRSFSRHAFAFDGLLLTEDSVLLVKASQIHLHGVTCFVL